MPSTNTAKIPAVCITITRAEGPANLCGKTRMFAGLDCWAQATASMQAHSHTYPAPGGGYDKHDFAVVFADGETYEGRLDAQGDGTDCDVQAHVRAGVTYMANRARSEQDRVEAAAFLATHDIG